MRGWDRVDWIVIKGKDIFNYKNKIIEDCIYDKNVEIVLLHLSVIPYMFFDKNWWEGIESVKLFFVKI